MFIMTKWLQGIDDLPKSWSHVLPICIKSFFSNSIIWKNRRRKNWKKNCFRI